MQHDAPGVPPALLHLFDVCEHSSGLDGQSGFMPASMSGS